MLSPGFKLALKFSAILWLAFFAFLLLTGAATGISANQIRTAAPVAVDLAGVAASEGTAQAVAKSSHAHSITGILPLANGGTGSATKNFVDLTTNQTAAGNKTFTGQSVFAPTAGPAVTAQGGGTGYGVSATGGATNGGGYYGIGQGAGAGGDFYGGPTNGRGLTATGVGSGEGATLSGGATGAGATISGGATSGTGASVSANGTSTGLTVSGGQAGGGGYAATFLGGGYLATPSKGTINLQPAANAPSAPNPGDVWFAPSGVNNTMGVRLNSTTHFIAPLKAGQCILGTNCAAIALPTTMVCTCADATAANACKPTDPATTVTFTGTGTDKINYTCMVAQ